METTAHVLSDVKVLELGDGAPGAYCGKLLAGLGARVIKVEPPQGEGGRRLPPFVNDRPSDETSIPFLYLNTSKQSITLDLLQGADRARFRWLVGAADVLVESSSPGALEGLGLGYAELSGLNPRLIMASITPFGQDGPYHDYLTNEIVAEALGGILGRIGLPEREPVKIGGTPVLHVAGGAAFSGIMAAICQRDETGEGQYLDISIHQTAASSQYLASVQASFHGTSPGRVRTVLQEAADGWVSSGLHAAVTAETWPRVSQMLGRSDLVDDPRFATSSARRMHRSELSRILGNWLRSVPKEDAYHLLQELQWVSGYVATMADVYQSRQLNERGFFQEVYHPKAGLALYPGLPFRIGDNSWAQTRAPLLGEHNDEIAAEGIGPCGGREKASTSQNRRSQYALEGVRILDVTQRVAGPYMTFALSSLGAEVIKVESNRRPDNSRGSVRPSGSQEELKSYPRGVPGEHPWNRVGGFNQRNRGKLGITLDLSQPEGKELFKRLVVCCDALVENFRASVMERQDLGWDVLHELNPRLVYLKLSSQGNSGPERDYGSIGPTLEQTGGLASITGYSDGIPLMTNQAYLDPVAAILGAGALIAGLRQARRTGEGMLVDFSQRELTVGLIGDVLLDYAFNDRVQGPTGNRSPVAAPQGVYPCAGEDSWIAISIETDAQWSSLCAEVGDPAWTADSGLSTAAGRRLRHDETDVWLAAWTRGFDHIELMHRLQRGGVPAGAVLTGMELLADPQLETRGWWEDLVPTEVGELHRFIGTPWRLSGSPYRPSTPAPLLGEHNDAVYLGILGLSREEYAALQAKGIISTEPLWDQG